MTFLSRNTGRKPKRLITILKQAAALAWTEADGFVKKRLILTLFLVLCISLFSALAPIALKFAIDGLTTFPDTGQLTTINQEAFSIADFTSVSSITIGPVFLLLVYIFSLWLSRSLGEIRWFFFGTADQRLHRRLSRHLFSHIMMLPMAFHLERKTGALNQTLVQGLAGYSILLNHAVFSILPIIVELLIISVVLAYLFQPVFLIILGLSTLAYGAAFALGVNRITGPVRNVANAQIKTYANLTDSILNYETVKYFNAEQHINDRYDKTLAATESHWATFYGRKTMNGLLVASIFALSLGSALVIAAGHVMQETMTVGGFILINSYMLQIVRPLETLGAAFRDMAQGTAFIERMISLLNQNAEGSIVPEKYAGAHIPPDGHPDRRKQEPPLTKETKASGGTGKLVFNQVVFSYHFGQNPVLTPILKDISFTIEAGKTLAIVGKSGAGKSSLIRLLTRLYDPDSGNIYLNGKPVQDMSLSELRQAIAVVPQDTVLFNDTIAYNIGLGKQGCTTMEIEQAARLAHIHDFIIKSPEGYQTIVGERGLKLSGGEKQRISIARAVLKNPQLFVFDEATSSLDSKTEREILRNLITISKGATTLIIAHRLSTVVHADEIIILDQSAIIERGTHDNLMAKRGLYASMWHSQHQTKTC